MSMMRAVRLDGQGVGLRRVPIPPLTRHDDVRIRVTVAGLCRTDLLVGSGKLQATAPLTLGHEFSGSVDAIGTRVQSLQLGDRVTVNPVFGCGICPTCVTDPINCPSRTMLGIDRDGAFAEFIVVPATHVYRVPPDVTDLAAAYAEPVAAALAVHNAGLDPQHHGLIHGANRFARLVELLLRAEGFRNLTRLDPVTDRHALETNTFDFAIETGLDGPTLDDLMRVLKPSGTLVIKSRQAERVDVDFGLAIRKQLTIRAVNYGPFRRAVGQLVEGRLDLTGLLGPTYPIEQWEPAFTAASDESAKVFLTPGAGN